MCLSHIAEGHLIPGNVPRYIGSTYGWSAAAVWIAGTSPAMTTLFVVARLHRWRATERGDQPPSPCGETGSSSVRSNHERLSSACHDTSVGCADRGRK